MHIDWGAFGEVFLVSFGAAVGVVVVFTIGIVLLAGRAPAAAAPAPNDEVGTQTAVRIDPSAGTRALAGLCFLACVAAVGYGLYMIIHK
jgi:hypothetical protein